VPTGSQQAKSLEEAEIRKLEAEAAEIRARAQAVRVRTVLVALAAAMVLVNLLAGGTLVPEHGELIGRLLP
jgi:hypothetical protein